jgi:hypothetical protein
LRKHRDCYGFIAPAGLEMENNSYGRRPFGGIIIAGMDEK